MLINGSSTTYNALQGLTDQIAQSIKNIKAQSIKIPDHNDIDQSSKPQTETTFGTLNNYAVSYLSPNSVYSLHKIVAEEAEKLSDNRQKHIKSESDNEANSQQIKPEGELSDISFGEELKQIYSSSDYAKVSSIYQQNIYINTPDVALVFKGTPIPVNADKYATEAYQHASELNQTQEPTIELLHKNNQNFDYKI